MPRGNGRGGRSGRGQGRGQGFGRGRRGRQSGYGPTGFCVCPKCKTKTEHQAGVPCTEVKCPNCGHLMIRKDLIEDKE